MYWMVNEEVPSLLGPMDEDGLWFFMATKLDVDPATIDAADLIRRGTGLSDLAIEIVATDHWVAHRLVADRYASGRVFLAGDACHLHPAIRRLRHEYGHRRCGRSRLEDGGAACRLGRRRSPRFLRIGAPQGPRADHRRSGHNYSVEWRTSWCGPRSKSRV